MAADVAPGPTRTMDPPDPPTEPIPAVPTQRRGSDPAYEYEGEPAEAPLPGPGPVIPVLLALMLGSFVSVTLGVYGRLHDPTFFAISLAGFSSGLAAKSWLATGAMALVVVQVVSARRVMGGGGRIAGTLHRWSGRTAILLTVPVAVHCLFALGFQESTPRVLAHSLAGCALYGAFVAKMLVLPRSGVPGWALPVLGGLLAVAFTAVWLTSALWFFGTSGLTF